MPQIPTDTPGWMYLATVVLIVGIPALTTYLAQRPVRASQREIVQQVSNSHGTNLRDDLDSIRDEMRDGFTEVKHDIGGLREENRQERRERSLIAERVAAIAAHQVHQDRRIDQLDRRKD